MRTWTAIAVTVALATGCGNDGDGTQTDSAGATTTTTGTGGSTGGTTGASTAEPTTGGSGEATGTGTTGTTEATTGTTEATTGTMTTATTGEACISCADSFNGVDGTLCPQSKVLNDAVFTCVCMEACPDVCEGTCTMGQPPDMMCQTCQNDSINGACQREFLACLGDV